MITYDNAMTAKLSAQILDKYIIPDIGKIIVSYAEQKFRLEYLKSIKFKSNDIGIGLCDKYAFVDVYRDSVYKLIDCTVTKICKIPVRSRVVNFLDNGDMLIDEPGEGSSILNVRTLQPRIEFNKFKDYNFVTANHEYIILNKRKDGNHIYIISIKKMNIVCHFKINFTVSETSKIVDKIMYPVEFDTVNIHKFSLCGEHIGDIKCYNGTGYIYILKYEIILYRSGLNKLIFCDYNGEPRYVAEMKGNYRGLVIMSDYVYGIKNNTLDIYKRI
jgi:hypothetical protein